MVKTMKQDITKTIQFSNTFRYFDDTSASSTEAGYLDTNIKTGDINTPFRISICDKRDDFPSWIVNFPHMDSNMPAIPAYGVYISQLLRYARICTSKVDFLNRLRGLSLRLRQHGFETNLLQKSFNKFFNRQGLIVETYGAALREMRLSIQLNYTSVSLHHLIITYRFVFLSYLGTYAYSFILCACIEIMS